MILDRIKALLRDLFRSHAEPRPEGLAQRAARLEQNVLRLVGNMPTLPATASRAIALASDPDGDFNQFVRLVEGDTAIAAALLRVANSSLYASSSQAVKLPQAVVRLGMALCRDLILSVSLKSLTWGLARADKAQCEALWHHGHVTAALCRLINRAYRLGLDGGEYFAGLLHDLGRVLLLLADRECFALAGAGDFAEAPGLLQREREALGIDHCALGAWFGEHSQLPDPVIQAARFHHEPERADPPGLLVALVATADHMADHLQRGEPAEAYNPEGNVGLPLLWARWPEGRKERLLAEVTSLMNEALAVASRERHAS